MATIFPPLYIESESKFLKNLGKMLGASMGVSTHDKGHVERIWHAKVNKNSRVPPDLPKDLPQNQNLSVLLFHDLHHLFWH